MVTRSQVANSQKVEFQHPLHKAYRGRWREGKYDAHIFWDSNHVCVWFVSVQAMYVRCLSVPHAFVMARGFLGERPGRRLAFSRPIFVLVHAHKSRIILQSSPVFPRLLFFSHCPPPPPWLSTKNLNVLRFESRLTIRSLVITTVSLSRLCYHHQFTPRRFCNKVSRSPRHWPFIFMHFTTMCGRREVRLPRFLLLHLSNMKCEDYWNVLLLVVCAIIRSPQRWAFWGIKSWIIAWEMIGLWYQAWVSYGIVFPILWVQWRIKLL